jgi:hypothetical protein
MTAKDLPEAPHAARRRSRMVARDPNESLLGVWALQVRPQKKGPLVGAAFVVAAVACYAVCEMHHAILAMGSVLAALVAITVATAPQRQTPSTH